jgi:hypothetical protein
MFEKISSFDHFEALANLCIYRRKGQYVEDFYLLKYIFLNSEYEDFRARYANILSDEDKEIMIDIIKMLHIYA